jgi:hypothetical protein
MIIYFDKFQIENLLDVISYLRKNLNHLRNVIEDFGEIKFENGIDTIFLNPKNKLFTLISISYDKYKQINTVSFTGDFNIKFIDLEKNFSIKDSNYSAYDDMYFFAFSNSSDNFRIIIKSDKNAIKEEEIIDDIIVKFLASTHNNRDEIN